MNVGGAESLLYNLLNNMDEKYHFDFVVQSDINKNKNLIALCKIKNAGIYKITKFNENIVRSSRELKDLINKLSIDIIHVHVNALINIAPIIVAKILNIKIVIHSHNTKNNLGGRMGGYLHKVNRVMVDHMNGIQRVACGKEAGEWLYGKRSFQVIDNAICIDDYSFNEKVRKEKRKELRIGDRYVILSVGRFVPAKNHEFILKCFYKVKMYKDNAVLLLLGDGELKDYFEKQVKAEEYGDSVFFLGNVQDVYKYYSAADCLIFPSQFEGLPFSLIEAQTAGLPCFASSEVSPDANVNGLVEFLPLSLGYDEWARIIAEKANIEYERQYFSSLMRGTKYDIDVMKVKMEEIYQLLAGKE